MPKMRFFLEKSRKIAAVFIH